MKQVFSIYTDWEDYKNGMYSTDKMNDTKEISKSIKLLTNPCEFFDVALKMIREWGISSDVNLTNTSINRRAWIGQSACNYKYGVSEYNTKLAWGMMKKHEQIAANQVADKIISIYEKGNHKVSERMAEQMLF